ncbi:uncharacterized protein FIESC28_04896 [Fusarium coffeatum]|uniref:C2H2-type domain-containing protein n=1 Tax=Fusarium coffeatum TaxID=231269 RepID=A0A366RWA5_9HYPO|nr:uncharacterized protein FIESC28_04896 [Fusarium coffeatum]RBR21359.1 hypothetical protein FIESC28_04896 [Fusarium coffeatum]
MSASQDTKYEILSTITEFFNLSTKHPLPSNASDHIIEASYVIQSSPNTLEQTTLGELFLGEEKLTQQIEWAIDEPQETFIYEKLAAVWTGWSIRADDGSLISHKKGLIGLAYVEGKWKISGLASTQRSHSTPDNDNDLEQEIMSPINALLADFSSPDWSVLKQWFIPNAGVTLYRPPNAPAPMTMEQSITRLQNMIKSGISIQEKLHDVQKEFPAGWYALEQHLNATGHWYDNQYNSTVTTTYCDWECGICCTGFRRRRDCENHEINECFYCGDCDRQFNSWNAIQQHLNSSRHGGSNQVTQYHGGAVFHFHFQQNGVKCPFCCANYNAASGVAHHLERGCCPNAPLDRDTLYQEVKKRDPDGLITNQFLKWEPTVHYQATELAFNSYYGEYECYICHDLFPYLSSLNQHLDSPRHQRDLYHCPNRSCLREFTTLAGLINHLESESCRFMRFQAVQNGIRGLFSSQRNVSFR